MHNYLLDIAVNGLKGKKRSSIYLLLACFLSVTFAVVNVSITGSLNKTRQELRYNMYGEWNVAVYCSQGALNTEALKDEHIKDCGMAYVYGNLLDDGETVLTGIGTIDDSLRGLGHLEVERGKFPTEAHEIAMEADVLSDLGYDYELGQTLTLRIQNKEEEIVTREYLLCGIIREYTGLWDTGVAENVELAGACVTEEAAKEIGGICSRQYFFSLEKEDRNGFYRQLKENYEDYGVVENASAYGPAAAEGYHYFNLALILLITLAAAFVIYSVQMKEQKRSIQLFRTIGITKKQLSSVIFYETMLILLPAAAGGVVAGSLATRILLWILMKQSASTFYISIPVTVIAGILLLWSAAVFGTRLLIFRYSLRGRLSEQKRRLPWGGRKKRSRKRLGLLFLSTMSILTGIFCYMESLSPIRIDDVWSQVFSYGINLETQNILITDEYIDSLRLLPAVEDVVAVNRRSGTLEFPGMEENPFASLLKTHLYGVQPWDVDVDEDGKVVTAGPEGLWCPVEGFAEDNWDRIFQYLEVDIDLDKFRKGESVILYIPYNRENGVELDGKLYQDFGVTVGDMVTVCDYGRGELSENGTEPITTEDGDKLYEPYKELRKVSHVEAEVAGIITTSLEQDPYLTLSDYYYYTVIASNAFTGKMLETEKDGVWFADGIWSNQEDGYTNVAIYTGMDAEFLSTDYLIAKSAAEHNFSFHNQRERNTSYRQEAMQTLLHIWICGICIFLILVLIQLDVEMIYGLTQRRTYALLQIIGMSRRQLRMRLAAKGILISFVSCLLGHIGFFLYFLIKQIGTYRWYVAEFDYTGTYVQVLKDRFLRDYLECGWSLPVHLAFCAFGMVCVFLLYFLPQNRILKENIRENMS